MIVSKRAIIFNNRKEIEWVVENPPKAHTYEEEVLLIK
jgi:hypothetical protein